MRLLELATPLWVLAVSAWPSAAAGAAGGALVVLGRRGVAVRGRHDAPADDVRRRLPLRLGREGAAARHRPVPLRPVGAAAGALRDAVAVRGVRTTACTAFPGGCTSINRPTVHTIYPPVAEAAFDVRAAGVVRRPRRSPAAAARRPRSVRWLSAGCCCVADAAAAVAGRGVGVVPGRGRPSTRNNAHIDWLAVLLVVLAFARRSCGAPAAAARWSARRSR